MPIKGVVISTLILWTVSAVLVQAQQQQQDNRHFLQTPYGTIVGSKEYLNRNIASAFYFAFTGIQYGTAERFEESKLKPLDGREIYATQAGPLCPQWSISSNVSVGEENCLYLSVFTPVVPYSARQGVVSSPQLPVMVYLHSGGYMIGSEQQAGPRRLMAKKNVVLVSLNYRLGVFGYLSTGDGVIPGNLGGLDQITALQWVKEYIQFFGGNPSRVTIFGNSAGSASAHLLTLSPRAFGLFHAAIFQSSNALCDYAVESNPRSYAEELGEKLGCSGDSPELLQCFQQKSVEELISAQQSLLKIWFFPIRTAPVVDAEWRGDDAFLPGKPEDLMDAGAFAQVPVLTGIVADEGLMTYAPIHLEVGDENFKNDDYFENTLLPLVLENMMHNDEELEVVKEAVKGQYFDGLSAANDTKEVISAFTGLMGDLITNACHQKLLEKLMASDNLSVYSYLFTYKTPQSPSAVSSMVRNLREMGVQHNLFDYGVSHCDELFYIFDPFNFLPGNKGQRMDQESERVAQLMTNVWTSFANNGNPANGLGHRAAPWRPLRDGNVNYYNIPGNRTQEFRNGYANFWLRTVPYMQKMGSEISELETYHTLFWIFLGLFLLFLIITAILGFILWRKRTSQQANL